MKTGLTYDLRSDYLKMGFSEEETAEFDKEETVSAIEHSLNLHGFETERIGNVKELGQALVNGRRWDLVFNICEGMYGIGREAQVPAMLDAWNIPYVFSGPLVLSLTLHKGMTKSIVRDAGVPTADFRLVRKPSDIRQIILPFPLFAKPVAEGTGKGINAKSFIQDYHQLDEVCRDLLQKFRQPVLVEEYLSGREFTVGIAGTGEHARTLGTMEIMLQDNAEKNAYSYQNKENYLDLVNYSRAPRKEAAECERVALEAWKALECEDAGRVDIRYNHSGQACFIEVNPLAGLNPVHSDLPILCGLHGISYANLIKMIMDSALTKLKNPETPEMTNLSTAV